MMLSWQSCQPHLCYLCHFLVEFPLCQDLVTTKLKILLFQNQYKYRIIVIRQNNGKLPLVFFFLFVLLGGTGPRSQNQFQSSNIHYCTSVELKSFLYLVSIPVFCVPFCFCFPGFCCCAFSSYHLCKRIYLCFKI